MRLRVHDPSVMPSSRSCPRSLVVVVVQSVVIIAIQSSVVAGVVVVVGAVVVEVVVVLVVAGVIALVVGPAMSASCFSRTHHCTADLQPSGSLSS
jgi:hypothetical protein